MASTLFYMAMLCVLGFVRVVGVGPALYLQILIMLRPPFLRGVSSVVGLKAFALNVPARGQSV